MAKKQPSGSGITELKMALKQKSLGRLYFFHGEETFLLHHYLEQMKKLLLDPLTESFNYHRLNSETFELRAFADAVENLPCGSADSAPKYAEHCHPGGYPGGNCKP